MVQGLLADGQCFTAGQLQRCLKQQDPDFDLDAVIPVDMRIISAEKKSQQAVGHAVQGGGRRRRAAKGISPSRGAARRVEPDARHRPGEKARVPHGPVRRRPNSLVGDAGATERPGDPPDVLITELPQMLEVIA